jgi:hypothetical protein
VSHPPDLGIAVGEVGAIAPAEGQVAGVHAGHGAYTVPLHLERVRVLVSWQLAQPCQHRLDLVRHRAGRRIGRRVHAVDHPVLAARLKQCVAPLDALPAQGGDHLVLAELLGLIDAPVPDRHRAGAVGALRDLTLELEVLERVILGTHGEPVLVGMRRHPLWERPGREYAVVLQAQIPVQVTGVVLLDHESRPAARVSGSVSLAPAGLGCGIQIAFSAVAAQAVGHGP